MIQNKMTKNTTSLFKYLEKQNIIIDKNEFEFQFESHPDYPSLLAITDTLSFFNIDNGAMRVDVVDLIQLPDSFIALINESDNGPKLNFIEKEDNSFRCFNGIKNIIFSKEELESRWEGIVLLVEKAETVNKIRFNKYGFPIVLQIIVGLFFILTLFQFEIVLTTQIFFLFPFLGVLFSVAALKDLFGTKSELFNSFCNITSLTSCDAIVSSKKWKIFEIISFSDLSIVFFASQFFGLFLFLFSGNDVIYFRIQQILILASLPVLFLSIYYQRFVEKKWCPICLAIVGVVLLELSYLFLLPKSDYTVSIQLLILYGFIFVSIASIWFLLKKKLILIKELKDFQIKSIRFIHNYELFKNSLISSKKTNYQPLTSGNLIVGNESASLKITLISNPFCGFCKEAHEILEQILKEYKDQVCLDFRFNFNSEQEDLVMKKVHYKLVQIYYSSGGDSFLKALHNWFQNKDENLLHIPENLLISDSEIAEILHQHYLMNLSNGIQFTPAIIINGFEYPKIYERKHLVYFIRELLDDNF